MAFVNFNICSILSRSCLFTTDVYDRLVTVTPIVIGLGCARTILVAKMRNGNSNGAGAIVRHEHVSVVLFIVCSCILPSPSQLSLIHI